MRSKYKYFYKNIIRKKKSEYLILLDRDGVLNEDTGYIDKISRVKIIFSNLNRILDESKKRGFKNPNIVIVSNQSGISRGHIELKNEFLIMKYIINEVKESFEINGFYFCPYHPLYKKEYNSNSRAEFYRKPNPGMIKEAVKDFSSNIKSSMMIGDKDSDMRAAERAGITINNRILI